MTLRKKDIIQLTIEDLAFGGKGVAHHEGKVVFVEGGLPEDTVEAFVFRIKPSYIESRAIQILKPSPYRINPVCKHFDICGGCRWQNYQYDQQLKYKENQVREHLIRIGGLENPPLETIIAARKNYFYRNKMEFSFHEDRNGNLNLGMHFLGFYDRIFDIEECHLQSKLSNDIVNFVRDECIAREIPAYHIKKHTGVMRFLVIREGKFTNETMINIVTGDNNKDYEDKIIQLGKDIADKFEGINSIIWTINSRLANIAQADKLPPMLKDGVIYGRDFIYEKLNEYKFRISADSFFQTNSYQAQLLYDIVVEYADFSDTDRVCDLYCGTGTISVYISSLVKSVVGVELIENAVKDAAVNAELNSVSNVEFIAGKVEDIVEELGQFDKLIVDPPRAGIHPKALKGIIELAPRVIIYVSCNPSTLARDIAELTKAGYRLEKSIAVDMFPHTYHIESVSKLIRN